MTTAPHTATRDRDGPSASPASFPGFGEDAPLDLSGLTPAAEHGLVERITGGSFAAWADTAAAVGYCAHPVRLTGSSQTIDTATGEVLDSFASTDAPLGVLYRACGNRRADVCPACSRVYARDTFEMIRAGLVGGKTVPESVAENPVLFVTLTAPSFGPVHGTRPRNGQPVGGRCRPRDKTARCPHGRPAGCMAVHHPDDPVNGAPICPDCYQWETAIVWQWWASAELFRRTSQNIRRAVARHLGVPERRLGEIGSVQYAKVAEYQARGMVHFHALFRLNGLDGPGTPAPLDGRTFARLLDQAARRTSYDAPPVDSDDPPRRLAWGRQLDIRVVRDGHRTDDPAGPLTAGQVAGYLAKYATKDANSLHTPGQRQRPHLARLASTCRALAARAARHDPDASPYLLLGKWAHMLGFPGHFSTKSRRYSITLGALRRARHRFQQHAAQARREGQPLDVRDLEDRLLADDADTTLVIGTWTYQGTGWTNSGDEALALAAAARAREHQQWRADQRRTVRVA